MSPQNHRKPLRYPIVVYMKIPHSYISTLVVIPSRTVQPFLYRGTTSAESSCQPFCRSLPYEQLPIFTSVLEALTIWVQHLAHYEWFRMKESSWSATSILQCLFPTRGGAVFRSTQYTACGV